MSMKLIILLLAIAFAGCTNGGEKVEGRTTPATDSPYTRNDTGTRLYVDPADTEVLDVDGNQKQ